MLKKQVRVRRPTNLAELHPFCQEEGLKIPEACGRILTATQGEVTFNQILELP